MNKYLIIILFLNNLLSVTFDKQISNRVRYDFNPREYNINNYRDEDELLQFIESTMDTHLIPGISIAIVKDDSIVWEKQLGYANIINDVLVDENTMFILSSISKTVTATASQGSEITYSFTATNNMNAMGLAGTSIVVTGNTISGIAPRLYVAATYSFAFTATIPNTQTNNRTFTIDISQDSTCVSPTNNICT